MVASPSSVSVRERRGFRSVRQRGKWRVPCRSVSNDNSQRDGNAETTATTQSEQQRVGEQALPTSSNPRKQQEDEKAQQPVRTPRRVRVIRVEKSKAMEGVAAVSSSSSSGGDEYTMNFDEYVRRAAMLYAGDATAILLPGTLPASAARVIAWTLSATVLDCYGYTRVMTRDGADAAKAALTAWSASIALSVGVAAVAADDAFHEDVVGIALSAILVCAWRGAVASLVRPQLKSSTGDRKGSSLDLFQLLASLTRRW